ncbi:MAG TPA: 50S ribosomal protein L10 [Planctomycetes bacterium]|nr:50S ribosomal protein L10 [Planctomycetota bacterium]HIK61986.1 50S ribosomal protein L10 [Planctomycetota bacterium]
MPNIVNEMILRGMSEGMTNAEGMVVVTFGGLDVAETEAIRGQVAEAGASMRMVRNRLARLALTEKGIDLGEGTLQGNVAIAWGDSEATIGAAKVFASKDVKKAKKVEFRAGLLDGEVLGPAEAASLADVPDRDTLNAQLLGVISGPARALASVIQAVPSATARVLQARADSLPASEE